MSLNAKQQRFVEEYLVDLNATQAAIRAGYSAKTAEQIGYQLLQKTSVAEAVASGRVVQAERAGLTQEWVLAGLRKNYERAMQEEAVLDKLGHETGVFEYQGAVANRSLELVGKHLGMFVERFEDVSDMPREQRRERLLKILA